MSFEQGIFPTPLKNSLIVPIFKKGDRSLPSSYRPISITHNLSKIMEKLVLLRLSHFFKKFNVLDENQFGFKSNFSTKDAIIRLFSLVYNNLDNKDLTLALLLDLSKAFDKVNHYILIRKLESCGIRGYTLKWLSSFLHERKIRTLVNGKTSNYKCITDGVPQGAILSPILYNIFINDFSKFIQIPSIIYADDTILLITAKNIETLQTNLKHHFSNLLYYYSINKLLLNTEKTQLILFGNKNIHNWNLCNDIHLSNLTSVKYLGINIDNKLTINPHVIHIIKNINKYITIFRNIRNLLTNNTKVSLIKSLIVPHILYSCPFLFTTHKYNLTLLSKSYIRIIKILFKYPMQTPTDIVISSSHVTTINSIISSSLDRLSNSIISNSLPISTLIPIYTPFTSINNIQNIYNKRLTLYHTKWPHKNFIYQSFILYNNKISNP